MVVEDKLKSISTIFIYASYYFMIFISFLISIYFIANTLNAKDLASSIAHIWISLLSLGIIFYVLYLFIKKKKEV